MERRRERGEIIREKGRYTNGLASMCKNDRYYDEKLILFTINQNIVDDIILDIMIVMIIVIQ